MSWLWVVLAWGAPDDGLLGCGGEATEQQRMRCVYMEGRGGRLDEAEAVLRSRSGPWAQLNLANVVAARGGEAEPLYEAAVAAFADGPAEGAVKAWLGLRTLYDRAARHDAVDQALDRAWALAEGDDVLTARVDVEAARTYFWREHRELAVRYARRGLAVEGIEYQTELVGLHVLAGVLLELGQPEASWTFSERLVDLTAEAGDAYVEANTRLNALLVAMDRPHLVEVDLVAYARDSLAMAERSDNPYAVAGLRCAIAELTEDLEGLRACVEAVRAVDDPHTEAQALRALARLLPDRGEADAVIDAAMPLVDSEFVRAQLDHTRAAVAWRFGDIEESEAHSRSAVGRVTAMRDTHDQELARAGYATIWRSAWEAPAARFLARGDLDRAWGWSEGMRAQEQRGDGEVPTLEEVQASLGPHDAVVAYVFPIERDETAWVWVVRADAVDTVTIDSSGLSQRVDAALGLGRLPDAARQGLRQQVWAPLEPHLDGVRHVRVVPDGPLHRFPVGALLGEGDPVPSRSATAAPPATGKVVEKVRSLVAPTGTTLPASLAEGRAWVEALDGELLAGDAASSEALVGAEEVLHVASHAQVERWVGLPRLQLADGWLDSAEVAELPLRDKVVVWAVCGGSDGPVYDAEGAFSLARAARKGGARSVVAAAVPLPDRPAAEAFAALAEVWARGGRLDDAVAQVRHTHPDGAWALEVVGDGSVRVEASKARKVLRVGRIGLMWIGLLVLALGMAAWQRVKGR